MEITSKKIIILLKSPNLKPLVDMYISTPEQREWYGNFFDEKKIDMAFLKKVAADANLSIEYIKKAYYILYIHEGNVPEYPKDLIPLLPRLTLKRHPNADRLIEKLLGLAKHLYEAIPPFLDDEKDTPEAERKNLLEIQTGSSLTHRIACSL
jgi:hypothetical protein